MSTTVFALIGLGIAAATFVVKEIIELIDRRKKGEIDEGRKRTLRFGYFALSAVGFVAAIGASFVDCTEKRHEQARTRTLKLADDGRAIFHDGLTANNGMGSIKRIEMSFEKLEEALPILRDDAELQYRYVMASHDLALGKERVAYGESSRGCLYFRDQNRVDSCWVQEGSKMYVSPPPFKFLRCTDIANNDVWNDTRARFDDLWGALRSYRDIRTASHSPYVDELAAAARSAGYFWVCDYLRNPKERSDHGALDLASKAWSFGQNVSALSELKDRHKDFVEKNEFLEALRNPFSNTSCARECTVDAHGTPLPASLVVEGGEYYEWRFDQKTSKAPSVARNVYLKQGQGLTLYNCQPGSRCEGSAELEGRRLSGFREAIVTWDATVPRGTWIEVVAQVEIEGQWSDELSFGEWSEDPAHRKSRQGQESRYAKVDVDTLRVTFPSGTDHIRIRLKLFSEGSALPIARSIGVSVMGKDDPRVADLDVPAHSQMLQPDGARKCSPTSLAMLLEYWQQQGAISKGADSESVSKEVYDDEYKGYGNWSFNVAYVNSAFGGQLRAFVTRLRGVDELSQLVTSGIPVVVSVRWQSGEMSTAPLDKTDGHLLVVRGFTTKGDVIVNDPAGKDDQDVRHVYMRDEFQRAWRRSENTVYIVVPASAQYREMLERVGLRRPWDVLVPN